MIIQKSHYLAKQLADIKGVSLISDHPFFKEFVIQLPVPVELVLKELRNVGILGGINLDEVGYKNHLLIAVTEKRTKKEMDLFVSKLRNIVEAKQKTV